MATGAGTASARRAPDRGGLAAEPPFLGSAAAPAQPSSEPGKRPEKTRKRKGTCAFPAGFCEKRLLSPGRNRETGTWSAGRRDAAGTERARPRPREMLQRPRRTRAAPPRGFGVGRGLCKGLALELVSPGSQAPTLAPRRSFGNSEDKAGAGEGYQPGLQSGFQVWKGKGLAGRSAQWQGPQGTPDGNGFLL